MAYRIQSGDTLSAIAARFGTTVDAIVRANHIANPNLIHVGEELDIPGKRDDFDSSTTIPQGDLQQGNQGTAVRQLQDLLVKTGHLSAADMTTGPGIFGPRTASALRGVQSASGVPATGYYGALTRAAFARVLGQPSAPRPAAPSPAPSSAPAPGVPQVDLQRGSQGDAVRALQAALVRAGSMSQADMNTGPGTFGPRTEAAVRAFQSSHGVPVTGYYGPLTRAALSRALGGAGPVATPTPPASGGDFRQRALSAAEGELGRWNMYRYLNGDGPEAWCNDFVSWAYQQAGKQIGPRGWYRYVPYMQQDLKASGQWLSKWANPSPGDIVCFDWNNNGVPDHTGIVEKVNADGTITTIEGNVDGTNSWNGSLKRVVRSRGTISGFGHLQ